VNDGANGGPTDLYRYYDADDNLLYVGISFSAVMRASQHRSDKGWWRRVDRMTVEHLPDRATAERLEMEAIKNESPIHNVVGNDGKPATPPQSLSGAARDWVTKWSPTFSRVVVGTRDFQLCSDCSDEVRTSLNVIYNKNSPTKGHYRVPVIHWITHRRFDNCESSGYEAAESDKSLEGFIMNLLDALDEADMLMARFIEDSDAAGMQASMGVVRAEVLRRIAS